MTDLSLELHTAARVFNEHLQDLLSDHLPVQPDLADALRYTLLGSGKRVRPLLVYAAARAMGHNQQAWITPALAIELIHTYSLVHDDLPAMDDDQWRRGRPTAHVAFDQATAILAGDALQSMAFQVLSDPDTSQGQAQRNLSWVRILSQAAGQQGMVDGQAIDCHASSTQGLHTLADLEQMHRKKTGALIEAAVHMGALCGERPPTDGEHQALSDYADALGLAFQVVDDILDVTSDTQSLGKDAGSDAAADKVTYVSALGLDAARARANALYADATAALRTLPGDQAALKQIADYVVARAS